MAEQERHEPWEAGITYVIGHQRPDTDAIASALGYAWYLSELEDYPVVAARTGHPAVQTQFALRRFELRPPRLLTSVAPTFGHIAVPQACVSPESGLSAAMAQIAAGARVVPVARGGVPRGVVTPMALAHAYGGAGRPAVSCGEVAEAAPVFGATDRLSDYDRALLRRDQSDYLVTDGDGKYLGLATQAAMLNPPRARLVLVDHNELTQAVSGAAEAEIVGVLDHHRLGNPPTSIPIPFLVDPVGSTCTLVTEACRRTGLVPPASLAGLMLAGILSDTLVFRSPTVTDRDRNAAGWLAKLADVDGREFGDELLRASPGLAGLDPGAIVDSDRKSYEMAELPVSIAQIEVSSFAELSGVKADLLAALEDRREREGLALIGLMVTNIVSGQSRWLCVGEPRLLIALPFSRVDAGEWDLGDFVSRKKQLVPALESALEFAA
ncbi:MAG: DHHA2 domain-containing protein [Armatimonadota bacterium]